MTKSIAGDEARMFTIAGEQVGFFAASNLIKDMPSRESLAGELVLTCVETPSTYRNLAAKLTDKPKTDQLEVVIDRPTIEDLVDELTQPNGLDEEDIVRLSVGMGIANLLVYNSFAGLGRMKKMNRLAAELSEPQGLYSRTMDSAIFDNIQADETATAISTEGHRQTANVNATRLTAGMFIEVQPDPKQMRAKVEQVFQEELSALFDGKTVYMQNAGLFNVEEKQAEDMYSNSVEVMLGLSFPMNRKETAGLLKILR